MRLVVDLTIVRNANKITGIERVALESVKHIVQDAHYMSRSTLVLLCSKTGREVVEQYIGEGLERPEVQIFQSPFANRILTDQVWLPYAIARAKPEAVYYTTLGIPWFQSFKFTMIVHDAVPWALPQTTSKGMKYYYKPLLERAARHRKLNKVVTVSQFSKKEIGRYLSIPPERIHVNYLGLSIVPDQEGQPEAGPQAVLDKYGIDKPYLISIGTLEPRKNLKALLKSFKSIKENYGYEGKLVIVGRKGWIKELEITEAIACDIVLTGYVSDAELTMLLKGSEAFVFPSLYEGFGLPLIEAMSLGVPVISSNQGSLMEVGGESCAYFDPHNESNMSEKIYEVLHSQELKARMAEGGKKRATEFTWEEHSHRLLNILNL